jgi:ribonuclease R
MPERPVPDVRPEALVAELRRAGGRAVSLPDLLQRAHLHPKALRAAKKLMKQLVRDGTVQEVGGRFATPAAASSSPKPGSRSRPAPRVAQGGKGLLGLFTRHRDGFGFLARLDRQGPDLFVAPGDGGKAVDGDVVRFEIFPGRRGEQGRITEVVERGRRMLIGAYAARGRESFVVPIDDQLPPTVPVPETGLVKNGEIAKVWLDSGPGPLAGRVVDRIPNAQAPSVEVLRAAYAHGFADVFPEEVLEAAAATPDRVRKEDWHGRRDLTGIRLVTIDGEDARDFDDAVYVEKLPGRGYRLVVAIADVSHYVRPGRPLDAEALRRGTSVYFPGTVLPMLPERLSNGVCSLNPEVERLCMVADMRFDASGTPGEVDVYPAVMRSAARCTYTEVARMLDGERVPPREFLRDDFVRMGELQEILGGVRRRRGSIDFDLPESKVVLAEDGKVLAIERRPRNRAHRIVEEFMLAANEAVARWFGDRDLPTIYRVHGLPDEDKLQTFLDLARAQGFEVPEVGAGPLALAGLLDRLAGHAQQRALNQLLLRAMMQAVYSPENIGHYGLAAEHYLHFTSPIRRYPDLVVHRLLRDALGDDPGLRPRAGELERIAMVASDRERAAMKSERDVSALHGRPDRGAKRWHGRRRGRVRDLRVDAPVVRRGAREGRGPGRGVRPRQGGARAGREAKRARLPGGRRARGRGFRIGPGPTSHRPAARRGRPGQGGSPAGSRQEAVPEEAGQGRKVREAGAERAGPATEEATQPLSATRLRWAGLARAGRP